MKIHMSVQANCHRKMRRTSGHSLLPFYCFQNRKTEKNEITTVLSSYNHSEMEINLCINHKTPLIIQSVVLHSDIEGVNESMHCCFKESLLNDILQ